MSVFYKAINIILKRGSTNDGSSIDAAWGWTGSSNWGYEGYYDECWYFNASKDMTQKVVQQLGTGGATGDVVWVRNERQHHTQTNCWYDRTKYHPLRSGRYLQSVKFEVWHGEFDVNEVTAATYTFKKPNKPTIADPAYDTTNSNVTFTVTAAADDGQYERYDTMYRVLRQDSANRGNEYKSEQVVVGWTSTTDGSKDVLYKLPEANALPAGQWVKITCQAYSRGIAGDSATTSVSYVYGRPAQASITSIVVDKLDSSGIVTVRLKTNATSTSPVDTIKLQRLKDSTLTNATDTGLANGWTDVENAVDDGNCTGLSDQVSASLPTVRTHTWYRLVTTHGSYTQNSVPMDAKCLYRTKTPAEQARAVFARLEPLDDGVSLIARIGWLPSDSGNATQVSWSQYEDAWESTEQPSVCDITWQDSATWTNSSNVTYNTATVTIRGLEESTEYYVRARRGLTGGDSEEWGPWCYPATSLYPVSTAIAPSDVVLTVPAVVQRGDGIDCSWTFTGSEQTQWQVVYQDQDGSEKVLASGMGPAGTTTIPASAIEGMSSVKMAVKVTCGGDWGASGWLPVAVEDAPEVSLSVDSTITEQPLTVSLTSTSARCNATIYVVSHGVTTATPSGKDVQADGDIVWAEALSPQWDAAYAKTQDTDVVTGKDYYLKSGSIYVKVANPVAASLSDYYEIVSWTATVTAPIIKLYEGASYSLTASVVDTMTLLSSDVAEADFVVQWSHRAKAPDASTSLDADADSLSVTITPVIPTGYDEGDGYETTDVVDIYRTTPDGSYLIASDVPFGVTVKDDHAPYSWRSELAYTLCTRTKDGDVDWAEYPYTLPHKLLRFDFGGNHVDLPYNIVTSDSWEKSSEIREHMDGTRAGYWNAGATRKASLSTDLVRLKSSEERRLVADLARYAGPCFVRTPGGCAYSAHVEVEGYEDSYESAKAGVSFSATEVALTDEYRIAPNEWYVGESGVSA